MQKKIKNNMHMAMALGGFAIGTSEFVAMGILPEMAQATQVSIAVAGQYIAFYAMGVVVGAPILAVLSAQMQRKLLLICLMLFYGIANLFSACCSSYGWLLLSRFIAGLPHGVYFGTATFVAAELAAHAQKSKAVGNVMLGLTIATVFGAPLATYAGQVVGWRFVFVLVALIAWVTAFLIAKLLPDSIVFATSSARIELQALKKPQLWYMLMVVCVGASGLFCIFSYIKPILQIEAGYALWQVPFIMPILGLGMVAGNILGPRLASYIGVERTIIYSMLYSAFANGVFMFFCQQRFFAALACFAIGLSFASMPSIQVRIVSISSKAPMLAGALIQAAYNVANALGAWGGGVLIASGYPFRYTAIVAMVTTLLGLLLFLWSLIQNPAV
ncbi:MAG: MFS transporter [Alphaproteobacteria bacterium]|nr:MFS transporter [Alphaproteobacteria bacterium]